jgi:hypothetical protein
MATEALYVRRFVDAALDDLLAELSAVLVVGPRASGKTTTLSRRAATIVRLDVPAEAAAFRADPDAALRGLVEPVLLDEWQQVPEVLGAVRRAIDVDPSPSRFLVTGSVRAHLDADLWPATGRLVRIGMHPLAVRELQRRTPGPTFLDATARGAEPAIPADPPDLRGYVEIALTGGFPQPALRLGGPARRAWYTSYVDDLLSHDVERFDPPRTRRRDPERLRRYLEAWALNSAGTPDHKTLYDAAGINRLTALAYDALLAGVFVAEEVPAWSTNRLKRLTHLPKRYLVDPALVGAALRVDVDGVLRDGDLLGRLLDTFVAAQLRPELAASSSAPRLHHVRTAGGVREVDLLAELGGGRVVGVEVKAASAPTRADAAALEWLRDELGDRFAAGVLLHTGPRAFALARGISAVPIAALWA